MITTPDEKTMKGMQNIVASAQHLRVRTMNYSPHRHCRHSTYDDEVKIIL